MKNFFKRALPFLLAFALIALPVFVLAQSGGVEEGLSRISGSFPGQLSRSQNATQLIGNIIRILLFFAGLIAVVFIIIGGYWYITSAGNEEQAEKGKSALINALIGVVVVVLSWVIVNVVVDLVSRGTFF